MQGPTSNISDYFFVIEEIFASIAVLRLALQVTAISSDLLIVNA